MAIAPIPGPNRRFSHLYMDLIGRILSSADAHNYIFTIVVHSSRWLEAIPLKDNEMYSCLSALLRQLISCLVCQQSSQPVGAIRSLWLPWRLPARGWAFVKSQPLPITLKVTDWTKRAAPKRILEIPLLSWFLEPLSPYLQQNHQPTPSYTGCGQRSHYQPPVLSFMLKQPLQFLLLCSRHVYLMSAEVAWSNLLCLSTRGLSSSGAEPSSSASRSAAMPRSCSWTCSSCT